MREKTLEEKFSILEKKILDDEFQKNEGLANEIGYYILDYNPLEERNCRNLLRMLKENSKIQDAGIEIKEFNLLDIILAYLDKWGYRQALYDMEQKNGLNYVKKQIENIMEMDENHNQFVNYIEDQMQGVKKGVIVLTGLGEVFPVIRAHNLLNNMQQVITKYPVIMLFPGNYTGTKMSILGSSESSNYYRAFPIA